MEACELAFVVYACYTVEKYREQIHAINRTWGRKCQEYPTRIRLLFFLGEENRNLPEFQDTPVTKYIHLPGVQNDYLSASYKQWLGMKYVHDHYQPNFIHVIGTDTFVNVPKMLSLLETFQPHKPFYLGGDGGTRQVIADQKPCYYHSGGPGFVLPYTVLATLAPTLENLTDEWIQLCKENHVDYLYSACDVAIGYYLQKQNPPVVVLKADGLFISCNYMGWPCHVGEVNMEKIIVCHFMQPHDCDRFTEILESNEYFLTV